MEYIPNPKYKIVRYNNPPGSPDLSIKRSIYNTRQQNAQGIVSPDYQILVYPSVYYYPNSASTSCDLFVIPLEDAKSNLDKIMTANTSHRIQTPILSTDTDNKNYGTFRTITPIDFSNDGSKLLAKEKIGNVEDGIWQTRVLVYDFRNRTSYDLVEVRDAISYYWKNKENLNLDEKRWDIYPLGFSVEEPDRIVVESYAYTGSVPVNLGIWSIDSHGEQSRLVSLNKTSDISISENGFKLEQDGVVAPIIVKQEQEQKKQVEKLNNKNAKKKEKTEIGQMKKEYQQEIDALNMDYKFNAKEYNIRRKYQTTTINNEGYQKYKEERAKQLDKEIKSDEAKIQKQMDKIQKFQDQMKKVDDDYQKVLETQKSQAEQTQNSYDSNPSVNEPD